MVSATNTACSLRSNVTYFVILAIDRERDWHSQIGFFKTLDRCKRRKGVPVDLKTSTQPTTVRRVRVAV